MIVSCDSCEKEFNKKPSRVKLTNHNYCSKDCYNKSLKKRDKPGENLNCSECEKEFYLSPSKIKRSKSGKHYCSIECARIGIGKRRRGENHPSWKIGLSSYRIRAFREYEIKCNKCGYNEYEEVLEVHHKDENRDNNDILNLEILCPTCHTVEHFLNKRNKA